MTIRYFTIILLISALIAGCTDDSPAHPEGELPIVIEGWIEDGQPPMVIVTRTVDLTSDVGAFDQYVEKWCRVSVDDGSRREILTARINTAYIPPFVYTATRMRGKVGGTYRLLVETETATYSAETTIPAPVRIDSVRVTPADDGLNRVNAFVHIDPADQTGRYYKFFSRVNGEPRYYSSFLGTFEGAVYDPAKGYAVNRGLHNTFTGTDKFTPLYASGDTVRIKLCAITRDAFDFWNAYENAVSLGGNMFFNVSQGCPSNIPGAKGYWAGYGTSLIWAPIP